MTLREKNVALLHYSVAGDAVKVQKMLNRGANINVRNKYGDTPLHLAIKNDHSDTATLLINKGANVNAPGALDDSPLHVSIYKKQKELSELLLEKGADGRLPNRYGLRPHEMEGMPTIEKKVLNAAQTLDTNGNWTDRKKGRKIYTHLQNLEAKYVINSLVLQVIENSPLRLQILILSIKLGIVGSENKLANLLMVYGTVSMAEDYLNSGSSVLEKAGIRWANAHGYRITTGFGSHRATWGRF